MELITSLPARELSSAKWLDANITRWGIETGLHARLDASRHEDRRRLRRRKALRIHADTSHLASRTVEVLGSAMHYYEQGSGSPILFIHGNPTSGRLWRNVIPHVAAQGRSIAVDLIGMGRSGKPSIAYSYGDHYRHLDAFIEALDLREMTLVLHDWGAMLGFDYASRNPTRVRRIAFMEGVLPPAFPQPSFEAMGPEMGGWFRALKDEVQGPKLVIEQNMFVEQILPRMTVRPYSDAEMAAWRSPYLLEKDRGPLLAWPRHIPIAGEPKDVIERMAAVQSFMGETRISILLAYAEPGVLVPPAAVPWYVKHIRKLETAYVGRSLHFVQEDQPDAVGRALSDWLRRH